MLRPIRPYPLMPTLIVMDVSSSRRNVPIGRPLPARRASSGSRLLDGLDHLLGCEAELLEQLLARRRCAKMIDADHAAAQAHIAPPVRSGAGLDGDAPLDLGRQHCVPIIRILAIEGGAAR